MNNTKPMYPKSDYIKISGCILTRNDSQFIKECVEYILPYLDEIVILDANDDNETEEIIKNISSSFSKPIIYKRTTISQNFSKDRNELQSMASGDYVLHVDCDERFDIRLLSVMRYIIEDYLDRKIFPILFRFPRINQPDKINYPDYQIRLLNRKYSRWTRNVHEVPEIIPVTKEEIGMDISNMVTLDYPIIHLYKEKDELQKRWKDILYSSRKKRLLVISIFKNSNIWIGKILQSMNDLYRFNCSLEENKNNFNTVKSLDSASKCDNSLEINYSFIDYDSIDGTFETLEKFSKQAYILNIQLRKFPSINYEEYLSPYKKLAEIRNYVIEQSVIGFPLKDDDYILFSDDVIKFEGHVINELINYMKKYDVDIIAPMVYIENFDDFGETYLYDTLASRLYESRIDYLSNSQNINMNEPNNMSNIGPFYIMKYKVAKNIKYSSEFNSEQIEFCNNAINKGFKFLLIPNITVYQVNFDDYGISWPKIR